MRTHLFVFLTMLILATTRTAVVAEPQPAAKPQPAAEPAAEPQPSYCTSPANGVEVGPYDRIVSPSGFEPDHFIAVNADKKVDQVRDVPSPFPETWNDKLLAALAAAQPSGKGIEIDLVFKATDGGKPCAEKVSLPGGSKKNLNQQENLKSSFDNCRDKGKEWETEVNVQSSASRHTLIVFSQGGEICYVNRPQGVQGVMGDPIYVGIYADPAITWTAMQFSPCSLEDTSPAVFSGGDVSLNSNNGRSAGNKEWGLIRTAPRTCYNDHVDIKIAGTAGNTQYSAGVSLPQYTVYRATLQLGALFSTRHTASFDLAADASGGSAIHFSGDSGNGPEYVAALVLYGFPNYLTHLFDGGPAYRGRDLINDQGLLDRVGLVTGVGLTDPTRRFVLGASFELMYGLNVLVVDDFHRQLQLDGVALGDPFTGTADKIPTKNSWQHELVFGISLDVRYVRELFGGHIKP